jgi:hypothetical protein
MEQYMCAFKPGQEKKYFGNKFLYKEKYYPYFKEVRIARIKTEDRHVIEVFICALPAQTWTFLIDKEVRIITGTGSWEEYKPLLELLQRDMIDIRREGRN